MTGNLNNLEKVLSALQSLKCEIDTNDLAEFTNINPKNIGRYLKQLESDKLITRKIKQEGRIRYILSEITAKGLKHKIGDSNNLDLEQSKQLILKREKLKAVKERFDIGKFVDFAHKNADLNSKINYVFEGNDKEIYRNELITMVSTLAYRKQDYTAFQFKNAAQMRTRIVELIYRLST